MTQYLLGSLPEEEAERLDELSVTDDEFAAALASAEKDLVDAYAQDDLAGPVLEKFKSHYLASPRRREQVEFAQAFQVFAEKKAVARGAEAQAGWPAQAATERKASGWITALRGFTAPRLAWRWGAAFAALALLVTGSWLVFENARLRQQMAQTEAWRAALGQSEQELQKEIAEQRTANATTEQELERLRAERERLAQELKKQEQQRTVEQQRAARQQPSSPNEGSIAAFILAPQLRSAGQIPTVSVPAKTAYVTMHLELEPNDYPAYRVALLDRANNQTLWRSSQLRAGAKGAGKALSITLRAGLLKSQAYVLQVSGVAPGGASDIVGDYPFRVVK